MISTALSARSIKSVGACEMLRSAEAKPSMAETIPTTSDIIWLPECYALMKHCHLIAILKSRLKRCTVEKMADSSDYQTTDEAISVNLCLGCQTR